MLKLLHKTLLPCTLVFCCILFLNIRAAVAQQNVVKKTAHKKTQTHRATLTPIKSKPAATTLQKAPVVGPQTTAPKYKLIKSLKKTVYSATDTTIVASGPLDICPGYAVTLTAQNLRHPDTVQWYMNNVAIPGEIYQNYNAYQAGTYYAKSLEYTYKSVAVTVDPAPTANFTVTGENQCASFPLQFTSHSTGSNLSYSWNFGDGGSLNNTSTAKNPKHQFVGSPGSGTQYFYVTLTVTTDKGCSDTYGAYVTTQQPTDTNLGGPSPIVYNGYNYFRGCGSGPALMTFTNRSSTLSINKSYTIQWGDGKPDYTSNTFAVPVQHTYPIGTYNLNYIIANVDGCVDTAFYKVFVGSNPAVGLNNPGNTAICTSAALTFPVTGTGNNPPGTTYTVTYSDGSPSETYDTAPTTLSHLFSISSCGYDSGNYSDSFSATIVASNPCSSSSAVVSPIYVSQKPHADFNASTTSVCTNNYISFDNTSQVNDVSNAGCVQGNIVWGISPATGWNISSGSLGSDYGLSDPTAWNSGSSNLYVQFTTPGTYKVQIETGNSNCGLDTITKTICVTVPPTASFTTNVAVGCGPLTVKTNNTSPAASCGVDTYQWSVAPAKGFTYANGTNSTSKNPIFTFTDAGTYTIGLTTISPGGDCTSAQVTRTVLVTTKPVITLNAAGTVCSGSSLSPSATFTGGGTLTYLWTFKGGAPATSTSLAPGTITYSKTGTFTTSLTISNECGSTTDTAVVTVQPTPVAKVPTNQLYCAGTTTSALTLSSSVTGTTFTWTNSNPSIGLKSFGSGNIPVFTTINNTSAPISATITVIPSNNGCTGAAATFKITVNPQSVIPTTSSTIVYCKNEIPTALTATAATGDTLTWYSNAALTNKLKSAPTPSTAATGTTHYYVTQTSTAYGCESPAVDITVTVNPGITGNTIGATQTVCYNTSPAALTSAATLGGGSGIYAYQWQSSTAGGAWADIPGATGVSYSPPNLTATTRYLRMVSSGSCTSPSDTVTITVQGVLGNFDIGSNQILCTGNVPASLTGQVPTGGNGTFSYQWQTSPDNSTWSVIPGATGINYQPGALNATTYYRRFTTSGLCSGFSSVVTITVTPPPVVNAVNNATYCNGSTTNAVSFSSSASGTLSYAWTNDNTATGLAASGTSSVPSFVTINTAHTPVTSNISVTATVTNSTAVCPGPPTTFAITVLPVVHIQPIQNQTTCSGVLSGPTVPLNDAASFAGATVTYTWQVANPGIGLQNGSGTQIPAFSAINNTGGDVVTTVTVTPFYNYAGNVCQGIPVTYNITVKAQPTANAGSSAVLCAASTYQLSGNQPGSGFVGTWTDTNAGSTLTFSPDAHTYNANVNGLQPGTNYTLKWTITNNACGTTSATVNLQNLKPVVNTITPTASALCLGVPANIIGNAATGGTGQYLYSWESSTDNQTWTLINGEINKDLTINLNTSTYIRRDVNSGVCVQISTPVLITIKSAINNNTITGPGSVCTGFSAGQLVGSTATGGDGVYTYLWQSSTDSLSWQSISQPNQTNYTTPVLTQSTYYRRVVSSALCQGAQQSVSNVLKVIVNPNAKADFTASNTVGCVPFNLQQVITPVLYDDRNATYEWFANGVSIGKTSSFPAYSITQDGGSALIKLITTSKFGCDTNSHQLNFTTIKSVAANFTKDLSKGCGPVTVNFTNTSTPINGANYAWDFGNGQTSTLLQPGPITFQANPANRDTTYIITLKAITGCFASVHTDSVFVRPKPKLSITPDKTIGCSPFTVNITNASLGLPNTYTFDFGDGSTVTKTDNSTVQHTYTTLKTDTVALKVTAQNECGIDTVTYHLVIYPNNITPHLVVNGDNQYGCSPVAVKFYNTSVGANSFAYDFGDGNKTTTSSAPEVVTHIYVKPGVYTVTMVAANGCSTATATQTITVYAQPTASFTVAQPQYCVSKPVAFTNTSAQTGYAYLWDFKDGSTSSETNPNHVYAEQGIYAVTLTISQTYANGSICTASVTHNVEVIPAPLAGFTSNAQTLNCVPFTLYTNTTPANATGVQWDFGDPGTIDNTGVGYSLSHNYTKPGVYKVQLIAFNQNSCADTTYQTVRVTDKPLVAFTPGDTVLCGASSTIKFTNNTTYGGTDLVTYKWLINHVQVSAQKNLTNTFVPPLNAVFPYTYTVQLIAISTIGCTDTVTHTIQFNALPKAGYTVQTSASCAPFVVSITNTSVYANVYKWYLNNLLISTSLVPDQLLLNQPGNSYVLKLVVGNQFGCKEDSVQKTITTYPKPKALFTLKDSSSCNGVLNLSIVNQSTGATSYLWDFGDNTKTSTAATPTHIYGGPGVYNLTLVVYNGFCRDTDIKTIAIAAPPKAAFIADNVKGCASLAVTFQNLSTNANTYQWDFGDGTLSTSKNPQHVYNYLKSPYTVKLVAYGDFGCADSTILVKYISVTTPPKADFTVLPDSVIKIPDFTFTFKNTSSSDVITSQWNFGDGITSVTSSPVHTYLDTGVYKVNLIVTNTDGCMDTINRIAQVQGVPGYLFVPNAFEPGSGKEILKTFTVKASGLAEYDLKIFNKWGQLIWETTKLKDSVPSESWDGTMNGQPAPQGVYIWLISAKFINGTEWKGMKYGSGTTSKTGPIHLIR